MHKIKLGLSHASYVRTLHWEPQRPVNLTGYLTGDQITIKGGLVRQGPQIERQQVWSVNVEATPWKKIKLETYLVQRPSHVVHCNRSQGLKDWILQIEPRSATYQHSTDLLDKSIWCSLCISCLWWSRPSCVHWLWERKPSKLNSSSFCNLHPSIFKDPLN